MDQLSSGVRIYNELLTQPERLPATNILTQWPSSESHKNNSVQITNNIFALKLF